MVGLMPVIIVLRVSEQFERLKNTYLEAAKDVCLEAANTTVETMKALVPKWAKDGNYLARSLKTIPTDDGAVIMGAYYGWDVEEGAPFEDTAKLRRWCADKHVDLWFLLNVLRVSKPHPFIMPSVDMIMARLPEIIEKHTSLALQKAGFGGIAR
jgi:hypothetical protein